MNYKDTVLPIMRRVRPMLMEGWGIAAVTSNKSHMAVDVVTEVDTKVEEYVSSELKKIYPDIGFVGEENGGDRSLNKFWLMDPIDGTGHYIRGMPFCTSQLALIQDGRIVFGIVYDFVNDDLYWAEENMGAYKNEEPIRVSSRSLKESYMTWEINLGKSQDHLDAFMWLRTQAVLFKCIASGWEFTMIASGRLDGRININPHGKDYDFAPGVILMKEAGAIISNLKSAEYDYTNTSFICANPLIYKELTEGPNAKFSISNG